LVQDKFNTGFKIDELITFYSSGITTSNDELLFDFKIEDLKTKLYNKEIYDLSENDFMMFHIDHLIIEYFIYDQKYSVRVKTKFSQKFCD
jgi:hypothetical protein